MVGTRLCKIDECKEKASHVIFLKDGPLFSRCAQSHAMVSEMAQLGRSHELVGRQEDGTISNIGAVLYTCAACAKRVYCLHENVLGYLTTRQHDKYARYSKLSRSLHDEGFVVLQRNEYELQTRFPRGDVAKLMASSDPPVDVRDHFDPMKGRVVTSPHRRWQKLEEKKRVPTAVMAAEADGPNTFQKHLSQLSAATEEVVQPDIKWGLVAKRNAVMGLDDSVEKEEMLYNIGRIPKSLTVKDPALQFRSEKLGDFQICHADGERGAFNVVHPMTRAYRIKVYPRTHHLVTTKENAEKKKQPTIAGNGKWITLDPGQLIIFYTNLVHAGRSEML